MKSLSPLFIILPVVFLFSCGVPESKSTKNENNQIEKKTYTEFELQAEIKDSKLLYSIKSDVREDATVMVSASRRYSTEEEGYNNSLSYFSKSVPLKNLLDSNTYTIDDKEWLKNLQKEIMRLAQAGIGGHVNELSDTISISAVIPITNKPYPYKPGTDTSINAFNRIVDSELFLLKPISTSFKSINIYVGFENLKEGYTYILEKETPMMSTYNPNATLLKRLDRGSTIKILDEYEQNSELWYKVSTSNNDKGWINTSSLMMQSLLKKD